MTTTRKCFRKTKNDNSDIETQTESARDCRFYIVNDELTVKRGT